MQDFNHNKLELTGILVNSTFIDLLGLNPSGKTKK